MINDTTKNNRKNGAANLTNETIVLLTQTNIRARKIKALMKPLNKPILTSSCLALNNESEKLDCRACNGSVS